MTIEPNDPLEPEPTGPDHVAEGFRSDMGRSAEKTRRMAWFLTLSGAIPFIALAIALVALGHAHPLAPMAIDLLKTYGAVILSFLGGIRWGLAMRAPDVSTGQRDFAFSVIPSLVGWFSLLLPAAWCFAVLAFAFAAQGSWDVFAARQGVFGSWFAKLRTVVTTIVLSALVLAFLSVA